MNVHHTRGMAIRYKMDYTAGVPRPCGACTMCKVQEIKDMRTFLRGCTYIGWPFKLDVDDSEPVRLMECGKFNELANLNDGYSSAYNKLSLLMILNGGSEYPRDNDLWDYMVHHAFDTGLTAHQADVLFEEENSSLAHFVQAEWSITWALAHPVPTMEEQLPVMLERFKEEFPPTWYRIVLDSMDYDSEDLDLPTCE
jgi:hypothetical protein